MGRRTLPTNLLVSGLLSWCLWGIWEGELVTRSLGCPPSPAEALGPLGLGSPQGKQGLWGENTRQPRAGMGNRILWAASSWALKTQTWASSGGAAGSAIRYEVGFTGCIKRPTFCGKYITFAGAGAPRPPWSKSNLGLSQTPSGALIFEIKAWGSGISKIPPSP